LAAASVPGSIAAYSMLALAKESEFKLLGDAETRRSIPPQTDPSVLANDSRSGPAHLPPASGAAAVAA